MIRGRVTICVAAAALTLSAGAWYVATLDVRVHRSPVVSAVTLIDSSVAYAWGAFLAAVLLAIWISRLEWSRRGATVACGISVKVITAQFVSYALATMPRHERELATTAGSFFSFIAASLWLAAFIVRDSGLPVWDALPINAMERLTEEAGSPCT